MQELYLSILLQSVSPSAAWQARHSVLTMFTLTEFHASEKWRPSQNHLPKRKRTTRFRHSEGNSGSCPRSHRRFHITRQGSSSTRSRNRETLRGRREPICILTWPAFETPQPEESECFLCAWWNRGVGKGTANKYDQWLESGRG